MNKTITIASILILIASSIIIIQNISAQSIHKPSVPQFTVKIVAHPYDVPSTTPTYTIDPYTGKQEQATPGSVGYHVENKSIEVTIKNQPFSSFTFANGSSTSLYYNVRTKGYFGGEWTESYSYTAYSPSDFLPTQSSSGYTVLTFPLHYPQDAKVDFQVEAIIGHYYKTGLAGHPFYPLWDEFSADQSSGWSNTQTLSISETTASVSPSPTVPEFPVLAILPLLVAVPLIATVILRKKKVVT